MLLADGRGKFGSVYVVLDEKDRYGTWYDKAGKERLRGVLVIWRGCIR